MNIRFLLIPALLAVAACKAGSLTPPPENSEALIRALVQDFCAAWSDLERQTMADLLAPGPNRDMNRARIQGTTQQIDGVEVRSVTLAADRRSAVVEVTIRGMEMANGGAEDLEQTWKVLWTGKWGIDEFGGW